MNSKVYSFYKESLFEFKSVGTYNKKNGASSNATSVQVNNVNSAAVGLHEVSITQMAKGSQLSGNALGATVTGSTRVDQLMTLAEPSLPQSLVISSDGGLTTDEVTIEATDTISSITQKIRDLKRDINVSFDVQNKRFFMTSRTTGANKAIQLSGTSELLDAIGFDSTNRNGSVGQNAIIDYNGATIESMSNELSVNGLSLTVLTNTGSSSVTVTQDTEAIYKSVKGFIGKYNELLDEMNTKVNAESARKFAPLTSDEKNAMTEDDVKLWEDKIKKSLLRRDDILSGLQNMFRGITRNSGVDTSTFKYKSLSQLGIMTGSYVEMGKLHIDGDEDNPINSLKENKLRKAIEEDPESVMQLMTGIGQKMYDEMTVKMKSSSLNSALTFYNDKVITKQVADFETRMSSLEERLASVEERYYKQFAAMEQAMQQSNSTSSWLSQQLAGLSA
jgi:flagellar hook-associated protein 2